MHEFRSQPTKSEVLGQLRRQYRRAGRDYKRPLLNQAVQLLGSHRKAAIRALRHQPKPSAAPALILGGPREYHPDTSRPCQKNDNAHVEQRNWTHVRQQFGYERYDNPPVAPRINALCKGALGQMQNRFLPTHKLEQKVRHPGHTPVCMARPKRH